MRYNRIIVALWGLMLGVCAVNAQQLEYNNLQYEVIGKKQVRVVADFTDSIYRSFTEVAIPAEIPYNGKTYQVTEIGDQAFRYCHLLQRIQLPEGLRTIGYQSFMNCTQLAEIRLPQSLRKVDEMAFYGCSSLQTVYVGKRINKWSDMCFSDCTALQTIYHTNSRPPKARPMTFFNCSDTISYYRIR